MIYDVAIVGAGPAGASAAFNLEKSGYNIVLIDKEKFPRSKPCAGVLPPRIFSEISVPDDIVERLLEGYRIFSPKGVMVESQFPKPGVIVRREKFDNFMIKRLNRKPSVLRVLNCESKNDFVQVEGDDGSYKARIVVGADGVNSYLRKYISKSGQNTDFINDMAIAVQYEISLPNKKIDERIGNWFEVYYTLSYGYGWISPQKDAVKVGVGGVSDEFKKNAKNILEGFLENYEIKKKVGDGKIEKTEVHRIPMSGPAPTLTNERIILCGDAGGFVFPGTGEGIYYAIKSGRIAAEVINSAFNKESMDFQSLKEPYQKKLKENGLLYLRDVNFIENVLSSTDKAEKYVMRLKKLTRR